MKLALIALTLLLAGCAAAQPLPVDRMEICLLLNEDVFRPDDGTAWRRMYFTCHREDFPDGKME